MKKYKCYCTIIKKITGMNRVPVSAMLNSNYLKLSSGYNPSHAHAGCVCILETLNKVF